MAAQQVDEPINPDLGIHVWDEHAHEWKPVPMNEPAHELHEDAGEVESPTSPGEGWVLAREGPRGGKYWRPTGSRPTAKVKADPKALPVPTHLPENHEDYFDMPPGTQTISLDAMKPMRARPEGIANAARYMNGARLGLTAKRGPITLQDDGDGTYTVLDGNSTYATAKKFGWTGLPAIVKPKPPPSPFFSPEELAKPFEPQPIAPDAGYTKLAKLGTETDKHLRELINMG